MALPAECEAPQAAEVSIQIHSFLAAARELGRSVLVERHTQLVRDLNSQHAGRTNFRANRFFGMSAQELLHFRGGKRSGLSREQRQSPEHLQLASSNVSLPKNYDWRTAMPGSVGRVKDQAMCGSCWTFGLMAPVESIQAIRTGKLVELPEQFAVDCTWSAGSSGCDGGNAGDSAQEIIRKFGGVIPSAKSYGSYLSVNGYCKDTTSMEVGAKLTGWVEIPSRDEHALMQALYTVGPMSVMIQVPQDMLFYDSGVLQVESCTHNQDEIDHVVTATGFGTDEHGTPFWAIRNSWSTYWGDEGYINIARGPFDCCVTCIAGYPEVEAVGRSPAVDLVV